MSKALKSYFDQERGRQARLAERIDASASHLSLLAKGEKEASVELWRAISEATGIPMSVLLDDRQGPQQVPVLALISAGHLSPHDEITPELQLGTMYAHGLSDGDWLAFRVEGSSMNRISPPESVIFVNRRERQLVPNACYVISDHDGSATYKRYRPDPARFEPVSTEDDHAPIIIDNSPHIIGRVRRTMLDM